MSKVLKGHALVGEVLMEVESIVNRVARREVGEKMIVCGKSARWWESEVKDSRRKLYTVEPLNNGRIGSRPFVRCREVSLSGRLTHNLVQPLSTLYRLLFKHFSGHNNLA